MAEKSITETTIEGLKQRASFLANINVDAVTRRDLGAANFEDVLDDAMALKQFSQRVHDCSREGVPLAIIQNCSNKLEQIKGPIQRISGFDILKSNNPSIERQNHIDNFQKQWEEIYSYIAPHLCFAESVDIGAGRYTTALAEIDMVNEKLKADQERMKKLVVDVEKMAQRSGVSSQAGHFKELADHYQRIANWWIAGAIVTGVGLYFYVHYLHFQAVETYIALSAALVPRLITVTLLSTALVFCLRNFAAMMHNMIVNRHRETALTTFQTFVNSTDDKNIQNAVLVQSTQAIFSPQPSGYLKTETEMPQVSQVTEIARGIAGKE